MSNSRNDNPSKFQFSMPTKMGELSNEAIVAIQMGALASRLAAIERTRCNHPDGRPENVAEHSLMLAKIAPELAGLLYPELDENLVARFATIHDDVEAYVGDTPTDILSNLDLSAKVEFEAKGLKKLAADYAHMPNYVKLVNQYESQSVAEARFVRAIDKIMPLLTHIPNNGAVLKAHYSYDQFIDGAQVLLERDRHKFGEFDKIIDLRLELVQKLANSYLLDISSTKRHYHN